MNLHHFNIKGVQAGSCSLMRLCRRRHCLSKTFILTVGGGGNDHFTYRDEVWERLPCVECWLLPSTLFEVLHSSLILNTLLWSQYPCTHFTDGECVSNTIQLLRDGSKFRAVSLPKMKLSALTSDKTRAQRSVSVAVVWNSAKICGSPLNMPG